MSLVSGAPVSAGLPARTLGVTDLTISNFSNAAVKNFVFLPVYAAGGMSGDPVLVGDAPTRYYKVGAQQPVAISYRTPPVYKESRAESAHYRQRRKVRPRPVRHRIRRVAPASCLVAIRAALEAAGVEFIAEHGGGAGMRLRRSDG
jgi:hypothetical protein